MSCPSDLLNAATLFISVAVNGIGVFISAHGLEYFDSVTGTMREKRKGGGDDAISMPDLRDIRSSLIGNDREWDSF